MRYLTKMQLWLKYAPLVLIADTPLWPYMLIPAQGLVIKSSLGAEEMKQTIAWCVEVKVGQTPFDLHTLMSALSEIHLLPALEPMDLDKQVQVVDEYVNATLGLTIYVLQSHDDAGLAGYLQAANKFIAGNLLLLSRQERNVN